MIIDTLFDIIYSLFNILTMPIDIPSLPSEVHTYINTIIEYIGTGVAILSNYCHLPYLLTLFAIVIAIEIGVGVYDIVMFIIKKIPFTSIS